MQFAYINRLSEDQLDLLDDLENEYQDLPYQPHLGDSNKHIRMNFLIKDKILK